MRIIALSDLHGILPHIKDEGIELMLICGDIVPLSFQSDMELSKWWFESKFTEWVEDLPVNKVVFIGGNHDWICERDSEWMHYKFSKDSKATYLHHQQYNYKSIQDEKEYSIFGTPYCKIFGRWAFMRETETLEIFYNKIPDNVDILISHDSPTLGNLGYINQNVRWGNVDAGSNVLSAAILKCHPHYFFSGHIHSGKHELQEIKGITMANVSIVDEYYNNVYTPLILDIC